MVLSVHPGDKESAMYVHQAPYTLVEYLDTRERANLAGVWGAPGDEFQWVTNSGWKEVP